MAVLLAAAAVGRAGSTPSFQEIEESLTCQCGCGLTVHSCNHVNCPSALPLREEIRAQMASGHDKPKILAYFVQKYGEKILSSPTAQGFNLLAWVTPFVLLALAGGIVVLVAVRWSRRGQGPPPAAPAPGDNGAYREVLERELRRFEG
ncbi:cytochrome c-type biogenesis protein CcmH [Candidatus Binatia bacterium]|nr:cytochrome c-type biogenesis protein CcmH [Candidatus Binatia bacterium]